MRQATAILAICMLLFAGGAWADANRIETSGTGFVVDPRGYVLTSEHVVHRAGTVKARVAGYDTPLPTTIVSTDENHDIALLKVAAPRPLPVVAIGNSTEVKRQQRVLAIGYPFGTDDVTSTSGRIIAVRTEKAEPSLVTDAVVNPGNSGGPLLNDRGEAIGVICSLLMANIENVTVKAGESYAVPISFALPVLAAIPNFKWSAIGTATDVASPAEIDANATPAVVQILADRVAPGTIEGAAGEGDKSFSENALALIKSYLKRMKYEYKVETGEKYPVLDIPVKMDNASHHLRVVIDSERQLVYLFLNRYVAVPKDSPRLAQVLTRLMEKNWELNIGKFEWDRTDGEVRLSYTFTTENGVGFEAFEAIVLTLLQTGDRLWPDLSKLAGGS